MIRGGYGMYFFPIPARTFSELRLNPPMQGSYRLSWNDAAYTVDGLPNALLRYAPDVITGVNSANAIRIAPPSPGIQMTALNPDLPTARAHQYNFTIEHEVIKDTVVRAGFIGTSGPQSGNDGAVQSQPSQQLCLVCHHRTCRCPPARSPIPPAARTTRPSIGDIRVYSKFGYSNFTGVQLEAERRFSKGMAFQFFYLLSNSMSTGATPSQGGDFTVNGIDQPDRFLPGAYPASVEDRDALLSLFARRRHPQAPHPLQLPVRPAARPRQEIRSATSATVPTGWWAAGRSPAMAPPTAAGSRFPPPTGARSAR